MKELPIDLLRELLDYSPQTGELTWKLRPETSRMTAHWNKRYAGKRAFTYKFRGGFLGGVLGKSFLAHRVAWAVYHGEWPPETIDHINGDNTCNSIANLRAVSQAENTRNSKISKNNTSGTAGVYWWKRDKTWLASITVNFKTIHLGYFSDKLDAVACRKAAEIEYGFHANHGRAGNAR